MRLNRHRLSIGPLTLTFYDLFAGRYCFELTWRHKAMVPR